MTANNFNYQRVLAMEKRIKNLEATIRLAKDLQEWSNSFVDYIENQHPNKYNEACCFADENLEMTGKEYINAYIKPL